MGWSTSWKKPCSRPAERSSSATVGEVKEMMGRVRVTGTICNPLSTPAGGVDLSSVREGSLSGADGTALVAYWRSRPR